MRISPTDSACQQDLQITEFSGISVNTSLCSRRADRDVGKQPIGKKGQKASDVVLACTRTLKTRSCVVPSYRRLWNLEMSDSMDCCSVQSGCLKFSIFCQSLRPTTGEQHPVTIGEIKIWERGWATFGIVCTSANVAVVKSGINPTILYTVQGTEQLNRVT